jgi:pilus assembly protein CpaC
MPSLEAAARYGWIKIRKRATVITTSGHQASYEAGGEVNVAIASSQSAELRSIPYGARLVVTPRLSEDERILDLEVEAVVSDLTETTQDVPGRSISRVQTLVHLGLGQSIMLSGLEATTKSTTKEGLPYLSKIPIFGLLFGTRSHTEEQVEGIIVITPTVLDNLDREGRRRLEEVLVRFKEFDGKFEDREERETE